MAPKVHGRSHTTTTTAVDDVTTVNSTISPIQENAFLSWSSGILGISQFGLLIFVLVLIFLAILTLIILLISSCCCCCKKFQKKKKQMVKLPTVYKDQLPGADGVDPSQLVGQLEYTLEYLMKQHILKVGILKCSDLVTPPGSGSIDPFVHVSLKTDEMAEKQKSKSKDQKRTFTTDTKSDTANPCFNAVAQFSVPYEQLKSTKIQMVIYDADEPNQPFLIGGLEIDLQSIAMENYVETTYEATAYLKKSFKAADTSGQICVVVTHQVNENELHVNILEAKQLDLPSYYKSHPPETMVSVTLHIGKKKLGNKKTQVRSGTISPYFGQTLKFSVKREKLIVAQLTVKMKYKSSGVAWKNCGMVVLSSASRQGSGRKQWGEMLTHPKRPIGMWHALDSTDSN